MTEYVDPNAKDRELGAPWSHDEIRSSAPPYAEIDVLLVFKVDYRNWRSHISVEDDNGGAIFTGQRESRSTQLEVLDKEGNKVANSRASSCTTKIVVELLSETAPAHTFEIHNKATFGSPRYPSPTLGGQQMTWKNKMMSMRILYDLMDESGKLYAKFESAPKTQVGRLEIMDGCFSEDWLKEIVVTLLALLIRKLRNINDVPQYGIIN